MALKGMRPRCSAGLADLIAICSLIVSVVLAQNCYYPNGDLSTVDAACNVDGSEMCCPLHWDCLDNGLCYYDPDDYFERRTCTDQSWQSDGCPEICTQNNTAGGNEAILQCPDGTWCCDGNRSFDCCEEDNAVYFRLPSGSIFASISALASPTSVPTTSVASLSSDANPEPSTSPPSSGQTPPTRATAGTSSPTTSPKLASPALTTTFLSTSSASNGSFKTITIISTAAVPVTSHISPSTPEHSHSQNLIIGLSVSLPLALLTLTAILILLHKRSHTKHSEPTSPDAWFSSKDELKYAHGHFPPAGRAPELDSYPVAVTPHAAYTDKDHRVSELMGSTSQYVAGYNGSGSGNKSSVQGNFSPMTPGAASSTDSTAVQFSPPSQQTATPYFSRPLRAVNEEPVELWGGYVPYRPPATAAGEERTEQAGRTEDRDKKDGP